MRKLVVVAMTVALLGQSAGLITPNCSGAVAASGDSPDLKAHHYHCAGGKKAAQIQSTAVDVGVKREGPDGFRAKFSYLAVSTAQDSKDAAHGFTDSSPPKSSAHSPPLFILHSSLLI